jgi:hypothetical protein
MTPDDLAPFAVADGLLAKMAEQPAGKVTSTERQWMLDHAREALARVSGISLDAAGRELHVAAITSHLTEQYSDTFAEVRLCPTCSTSCATNAPPSEPATMAS